MVSECDPRAHVVRWGTCEDGKDLQKREEDILEKEEVMKKREQELKNKEELITKKLEKERGMMLRKWRRWLGGRTRLKRGTCWMIK